MTVFCRSMRLGYNFTTGFLIPKLSTDVERERHLGKKPRNIKSFIRC